MHLLRAIRTIWWRTLVPILVRRSGVCVGRGVRFYGMPITSKSIGSRIVIGDNTVLCSVSELTALGVSHPTVLRTLQPESLIEIGRDCGISGASICAAQSIKIGDQCLLGANVVIADTDFHPVDHEDRRHCDDDSKIVVKPVTIGKNVFIGAGSIILKGVSVGDNSVIGAMSVVSKDIEANAVYAGNPARRIRMLDSI